MLHFIAEVAPLEIAMLLIIGALFAVPRTRHLAHRLIRTGKSLARNRNLPLWARYGFVLATLPVPGPFDEIVGGIIAVALLKGRHAATVRAAWKAAA